MHLRGLGWASGGFGVGEEAITVELSSGESWDMLQLIDDVWKEWKTVFSTYHIYWQRARQHPT